MGGDVLVGEAREMIDSSVGSCLAVPAIVCLWGYGIYLEGKILTCICCYVLFGQRVMCVSLSYSVSFVDSLFC